MTSTDRTHPLLAQLEATMSTHGAQPERWPDEARERLTTFIAGDAEAARLFTEAKALDALLDVAPTPLPPEGLEARILAATGGQAPGRRPVAIRAARTARGMWLEAALLAASLFIGLAIGISGQALPALQDVALIGGFLDPDGEAL